MKKPIIFILMLLLIISSVTALNFVTGNSATLFGNCIIPNGSLGGDNMTLTVYYPNTTVFINHVTMNNYAVGYFNYTFLVPNVTGTYPYSMVCSYSGSTATASDEFTVYDFSAKDVFTVTNNINSDFGELGSFLVPILISILMLVGSFIIDKEHKFFRIFLFVGSFIPVFALIMFGGQATDNTTLRDSLYDFTEQYGYLVIAIVAYFLLYLLVTVLKNVIQKKKEKYKYD